LAASLATAPRCAASSLGRAGSLLKGLAASLVAAPRCAAGSLGLVIGLPGAANTPARPSNAFFALSAAGSGEVASRAMGRGAEGSPTGVGREVFGALNAGGKVLGRIVSWRPVVMLAARGGSDGGRTVACGAGAGPMRVISAGRLAAWTSTLVGAAPTRVISAPRVGLDTISPLMTTGDGRGTSPVTGAGPLSISPLTGRGPGLSSAPAGRPEVVETSKGREFGPPSVGYEAVVRVCLSSGTAGVAVVAAAVVACAAARRRALSSRPLARARVLSSGTASRGVMGARPAVTGGAPTRG